MAGTPKLVSSNGDPLKQQDAGSPPPEGPLDGEDGKWFLFQIEGAAFFACVQNMQDAALEWPERFVYTHKTIPQWDGGSDSPLFSPNGFETAGVLTRGVMASAKVIGIEDVSAPAIDGIRAAWRRDLEYMSLDPSDRKAKIAFRQAQNAVSQQQAALALSRYQKSLRNGRQSFGGPG